VTVTPGLRISCRVTSRITSRNISRVTSRTASRTASRITSRITNRPTSRIPPAVTSRHGFSAFRLPCLHPGLGSGGPDRDARNTGPERAKQAGQLSSVTRPAPHLCLGLLAM